MNLATSRHRDGRMLLAVVLTGAAFVGSGCTSGSGGSEADTAPTHSASPDGAKAAPGLPKGVTGLTKVPTDVPNRPELRSRVVVSSCGAVQGGWQASGTASNPGKEPATYRITVFFTTSAATVIGAGHARVTVAPGAKEKWAVSEGFVAPKKTLCVLRGVG